MIQPIAGGHILLHSVPTGRKPMLMERSSYYVQFMTEYGRHFDVN